MDVYFIRNCSDYSHKTRSLWFYSKDGTADYNADIASTDNFIVFCNFYKSFKYKAKLLRNTEVNGANGIWRNTKFVAPLKDLGNFWRSFEWYWYY